MTKLRFLVVAAVGLALMVSALPAAEATTDEYSFTVMATSGPLIGDTATGTFSYDTSSIIPGGANNATGLLTDLNFTWDGITYGPATANTGFLAWDTAGDLTEAVFGNNCSAAGCIVNGGSEEWFIQAVPGGPGRIAYSVSG